MLSVSDPVTWNPRRIAVGGVTGAGKSTLARRLAVGLDLPYTELDSLYHGPGWVPRASFETDVAALVATERWVSEWQYRTVRELIVSRADTLVWLDLPARVTLSRVIRRTLRRRMRREVLWNGNVEPPLHTFFTDGDHILRYALRTRRKLKTWVPSLEAEFPALHVVRLGSGREVERWVGRFRPDPREDAAT